MVKKPPPPLTGSPEFASFMEKEMNCGLVLRHSRWDVWRSFVSFVLAKLQGDEESLAALVKHMPDAVPAWESWNVALVQSIKADPYSDALGRAYMAIGQGSKTFGQYFTPETVARMMAEMSVGQGQPAGRLERGCEPTCGSGVMVLQAARCRAEKNLPPILWACMDLDLVCCQMASIQLFLNDVPAVVLCCDSLLFGSGARGAATVVSPRLWMPRPDGGQLRLATIHTERQLHQILSQMEAEVMEALRGRAVVSEPAV